MPGPKNWLWSLGAACRPAYPGNKELPSEIPALSFCASQDSQPSEQWEQVANTVREKVLWTFCCWLAKTHIREEVEREGDRRKEKEREREKGDGEREKKRACEWERENYRENNFLVMYMYIFTHLSENTVGLGLCVKLGDLRTLTSSSGQLLVYCMPNAKLQVDTRSCHMDYLNCNWGRR